MEEYEIEPIIQNLEHYEVTQWTRTRFQAYCNLQKSSTKKIKPTDLITFPWEKEDDNTEEINTNSELSKEDIQYLKEKARIISQTLETDGE
nr:MAG TPA: hypothetical protein [Caudoviricetes sp.]